MKHLFDFLRFLISFESLGIHKFQSIRFFLKIFIAYAEKT